MTHRILFVCLGNICRSPSAEGVLRAMAEARGLDLSIDSAGTGDWHVGEPPYGPMQAAASARGYDLSTLRARQVAVEDFARFDLILGMDDANMAALERLRPAEGTARLARFTDLAPDTGATEVPDPYYTRDFDGTLDLVETLSRALLDQLEA
ncbi:low molecular weight protein-tyrosine-phosphatase [Salipiger sp.]|uniref:low molecular weight protein-tyrosine-phosphatase n=1 Tax=Salipiger sp. TaxID=2078585 RepID=UPI003A98058B